ncbi:hypothetical protein [Fibrella forsythiae]|uniref:DUF3467 domain-containing protein n=1 Tax=Fibrella forsythiae TaxID=2817061 RepID=A0ABS3JU89_9BACT|nr:hypothetical protein [Fibrella forsythiae]MBO0952966.1 hypothetical protein [Fibrella forsythiae]
MPSFSPTPAFTQALGALCRQHGYDEFVAASFEPATGQLVIASGPTAGQLTPAMQAILEGCQSILATYQDRHRSVEEDGDEEEDDYPDEPYELD